VFSIKFTSYWLQLYFCNLEVAILQPWKQLLEHFDFLNILSLETSRKKMFCKVLTKNCFICCKYVVFLSHNNCLECLTVPLCSLINKTLMKAIVNIWRQRGFCAFQRFALYGKKSFLLVSNILVASNGNMKVLKPMLYVAETNLSNFSHLTTRFTAIYQPSSAEK